MQALVLIGYLAKKVEKSDWFRDPNVAEICSVSDCISSTPDDRTQRWTHNGFGLYNTERLAWETVPAGEVDAYTLFAYRMLPVLFDELGMHDFDPLPLLAPMAWPEQHTELPLDESPLKQYAALGYDAVARSAETFFDCSPLSCNLMADENEVNRYCLLDSLDIALPFAKECGVKGPEPGPYHLLQVLRKRT